MTSKSNLRKKGFTGVLQQGKTYVKFLPFARVLLFPTGSAILSAAFELNFPPAPCWFDKLMMITTVSKCSLPLEFFIDLFNQRVDLNKWFACYVLSGPIFGHGFVYDDESHSLEQLCCKVFVSSELHFLNASP